MKLLFNITLSFICSLHVVVAMELPGMSDYVAALPKIASTNATLAPAERIINFLCQFSCGEYGECGQDVLVTKVHRCMQHGEPIKLLLVSFAVKSCNEKTKVVTAGTLDYAEFVGLFTLEHMCKEIQTIYPPGAKVTIYTREAQTDYANIITRNKIGTDLFPEPERQTYQRHLQTLVTHCFPSLEIGTIDGIEEWFDRTHQEFIQTGKALTAQDQRTIEAYTTFWLNELDCSRFRDAALSKLGLITAKNKREQAQQNKKVNDLFKETAQQVAQCLLIGGKIMRTVLETCVPNYHAYIRLSVRAPENGDISSKLGITLIHGSQGTPWHNILVTEYSDNQACLMSVEDIEKQRKRNYIFQQRVFDVAGIQLAYYAYVGREDTYSGGLY